jgi:YD repeat-containing protein
LLGALTAIRNALPNAMVTTYTYKPLIGLASVTDAKGYTMYYEYDSFGRLSAVKDADGKIVSENEYHYKN